MKQPNFFFFFIDFVPTESRYSFWMVRRPFSSSFSLTWPRGQGGLPRPTCPNIEAGVLYTETSLYSQSESPFYLISIIKLQSTWSIGLPCQLHRDCRPFFSIFNEYTCWPKIIPFRICLPFTTAPCDYSMMNL